MTRHGYDIAWGAAGVDARAEGASFVARYYGHDQGKILHLAEAERYTREGVDIVTVFEDAARNVMGGRAQGRADAAVALACARACGQPEGSGIGFAADDDFSPGDQPTINEYFRGCHDQIQGRYRITGYGSFYVLGRLLAARLIDIPWQTAAWSGGNWLPLNVAIQQYGFGQLLDWNRTDRGDFGQWRVGQHRVPADPDWFLLPDEKHWVQVFDHFEEVRRHQRGILRYWGKSHEAHMIRLMHARLGGIAFIAARQHDWKRLHRDLRYRALKARIDRYAKEPH